MIIAHQLVSLLSATDRCSALNGPCKCMKWDPHVGHIPRGYTGCSRRVSDVKLVICLAEPGNPKQGDSDSGRKRKGELVNEIATEIAETIKGGNSPFHRNLASILEMCWLSSNAAEWFRRTWITEAVLCSAHSPGGYIPASSRDACAEKYLKAQIRLFPNAFWIALGRKADERLRRAGRVPDATARAAGMPLGNRKKAEKSWENAARAFHKWL